MLDSSGDTASHVQFRSYGLTSLANLTVSGDPASVNVSSGRGDFSADDVCHFLQSSVELRGSDSSAAGDQAFCFGDVYLLVLFLHDFTDDNVHVFRLEFYFDFLHFTGTAVVNRDSLHNAGSYGSHLGPVVLTQDGGHDVSAESRTGHEQQLLSRIFCIGLPYIDVQLGTVCSQTGVNPRSNTGCQVTTDGGRSEKKNLRVTLFNDRGKSLCIGLGHVLSQHLVFHVNHGIRSGFDQALGLIFNLVSHQDTNDFLF